VLDMTFSLSGRSEKENTNRLLFRERAAPSSDSFTLKVGTSALSIDVRCLAIWCLRSS